jgi:hypothetical protein
MQFQLGDKGRKEGRKEGADLKDRIPGRELRNFAASRCQIVPPHPLLQHTLLFLQVHVQSLAAHFKNVIQTHTP